MIDCIQELKKPWYRKIDEEVYKLYGLTPEEIAIVEENSKIEFWVLFGLM